MAQVRRGPLKNRDFAALKDFPIRCDDLLTTGVDNADWVSL